MKPLNLYTKSISGVASIVSKRKTIIFLPFILLSLAVFSQPANYVAGTQVCWNFNGRDHGYFKAAGNGERHILISFTGDGETSCSNYQANAPQKWLNDAGVNWDGRTVRGANDTIVWEVLTLPNTSGNWIGAYAADLDYFFTHIASIDTSDHSRFHIQGLSGGVARMWGYMTNEQGHNSAYRNLFSTTISVGTTWLTYPPITAYSAGRRHWVWHGTEDENWLTPPRASDSLYSRLAGHKRLTLQAGGHHSADTWDSCMSLAGSDTNTNRWLWMVADNDNVEPPACNSGGPVNYVAGTQVCWNYNGRDHGYFRAAGNGERHILISFTGDDETDCSDYQTNSPQKFLNDAGINWDGRTVRGPGDTIVWEILTIPNTSGNWMAAYASDINYFFANICEIDTSDHSKFHIQALGGGVARMWNYLINAQGHNSPYRNIFSTTISLSSPWLSSLPDIRVFSTGRRNWVWHGELESFPTPTAAGQLLYDSLGDYKRLTIQDDGVHDAVTFDSCMSLAGSDTNTNRWLWMVDPGGQGPVTRNNESSTEYSSRKEELVLYPNPATNNILISINERMPVPYRLSILDISGRVHKVISNISQPVYRLDISSLPHGIYMVQLESAGRRLQGKIIKRY